MKVFLQSNKDNFGTAILVAGYDRNGTEYNDSIVLVKDTSKESAELKKGTEVNHDEDVVLVFESVQSIERLEKALSKVKESMLSK